MKRRTEKEYDKLRAPFKAGQRVWVDGENKRGTIIEVEHYDLTVRLDGEEEEIGAAFEQCRIVEWTTKKRTT